MVSLSSDASSVSVDKLQECDEVLQRQLAHHVAFVNVLFVSKYTDTCVSIYCFHLLHLFFVVFPSLLLRPNTLLLADPPQRDLVVEFDTTYKTQAHTAIIVPQAL